LPADSGIPAAVLKSWKDGRVPPLVVLGGVLQLIGEVAVLKGIGDLYTYVERNQAFIRKDRERYRHVKRSFPVLSTRR
jgi:hypothetical protein